MKEDSKRSKGLIIAVVIVALVVVVAAILLPIGLKSMELNRRKADVEVAKGIKESVLKDAASEHPSIVVGSPVEANQDTVPGMEAQPVTEGSSVEKGIPFTYYFVKQGNSCAVYVGNDRTYNLANASQAEQYINK